MTIKLIGKLNFALLSIIILLMAASCKKNKKIAPTPDPVPITPTPTASRADLTRDSLFLYAKQVYLWNDALPSYESFNPRKYTTQGTDLANYNLELFDISQFKINPLTSKPYEYNPSKPSSPKYSYIFDSANKNPIAYVPTALNTVDLDGNGNDFGFKVGAYGSSNSSYELYAQAVYPGSPAAKAGITRGAVFSKINGQSIGTNYNAEISTINDALFSQSTVTLSGRKKDGTALNVTLNKAVYTSSPILKDTVLVSGGKKIGYLVFARFSSSANARNDLAIAFGKFATAGVTNLVVDLRYNGGGYVSTAQYMTNLIAKSSLTGQTMFSEYYNSLMQSGQATLLAKQPLPDANGKVQFQNGKMLTYADINYSVSANTNLFKKEGTLEGLTNIIFIVSGGTASASELVINSLKPFYNVKLVGTTTYGKPVGFFPIRLENKYDVYYSMFQTKNSLGEGEYFAGFTPDAVDTYDDATRDFGDVNENYLKKSIGYIVNNVFSVTSSKTVSIKGESVNTTSLQINNLNEENEFKGMIENRLKLKQ